MDGCAQQDLKMVMTPPLVACMPQCQYEALAQDARESHNFFLTFKMKTFFSISNVLFVLIAANVAEIPEASALESTLPSFATSITSFNTSKFNTWMTINPLAPANGPQLAFHAAAKLIYPINSVDLPNYATNSNASLYMLVFGGLSSFDTIANDIWGISANAQFSNEMWLFLLYGSIWKLLPSSPNNGSGLTFHVAPGTPSWVAPGWPQSRAGHSMDSIVYTSESGNQHLVVILFGGRNGQTCFGDTWLWLYTDDLLYQYYNTSWLNITQPAALSPEPRWAFSTVVYENRVYMMGGTDIIGTPLGMEVWMFELSTATYGSWQLMSPSFGSAGPEGRAMFTLGVFLFNGIGAPYMLVSGGWPSLWTNDTRLPLSSMWMHPLPSLIYGFNSSVHQSNSTWSRLSQPGVAIASSATLIIHFQNRIPTIVTLQGIAYSFSSVFSSNYYPAVLENLNIFSPQSLAWDQMPLPTNEASSNMRGSIIGQVAVEFDKQVLLHGGFNTIVSLLSNRVSSALLSCDGRLLWLFRCMNKVYFYICGYCR